MVDDEYCEQYGWAKSKSDQCEVTHVFPDGMTRCQLKKHHSEFHAVEKAMFVIQWDGSDTISNHGDTYE